MPSYTLDEFVADVRAVLTATGEGPQAVWALGPLLQRLAAEGSELRTGSQPPAAETGMGGRRVYSDPDGHFLLGLVEFAREAVTPVHSHESWGLLCALAGSERYTSWHRLDDGREQGAARLVVVQDHHLLAGDLAYWFAAPYNVHRQWAGPDGCIELVLHGGSGRRQHHFDLERWTWEDAPIRRAEADTQAS